MRLIDADALKEHVKKYTSVFAKYDWREICEMLNDAPTVDAVSLEDYRSMEQTVNKLTKAISENQIKHGHWIEANDISSSPFDAMKRCLCSECREWGVVTNYCPNCGTKMDEVTEDDTVRTV